MNNYYIKRASKEVFTALSKIQYPFERVCIAYYHSGDGRHPEYANIAPTYAEILDWLLDKGINLSISTCFTSGTIDHQGFFWNLFVTDENECKCVKTMPDFATFDVCIEDGILNALTILKKNDNL